jgi:uncharacterized iron-regulated membrane protein
MIRPLLFAIALAACVTFSPQQSVNAKTHASATQSQLAMFDNQSAAQAHCPRDQVVWAQHEQRNLSREGDALVRSHEARCVRLPQGSRCRWRSRYTQWTVASVTYLFREARASVKRADGRPLNLEAVVLQDALTAREP